MFFFEITNVNIENLDIFTCVFDPYDQFSYLTIFEFDIFCYQTWNIIIQCINSENCLIAMKYMSF